MKKLYSKRDFLKKGLFITLAPAIPFAAFATINDNKSSFMSSIYKQINRDKNLHEKFSADRIKSFITIINSQSETKGFQYFQRLINHDFTKGDTLMIQGYIFSHTEIALYLCEDRLTRENYVI